MAAKRRRKSQGDAPAGDSAEGSEAAEGTDAAEGAEAAEGGGEVAEAGAAAEEAGAATQQSPAARAPQPAAQTPALTRPEANAPARSVRELGQHTAMTYQQNRDAAAEFVETARQRIREQPVQSVLVAAGVGILIGIIWR